MYGTGAASGTRGWIIPCHLLRLCYKVSGAWCCWLSWGQVSVTHNRRGSRLSHLPQQKNLCWGLHLAPVVFHAHPWTSHWDRKRVLWLSWGRGLGFVSRESGDKVSWADKSKSYWGSVLFSCSVMSDSLRPYESQHTRPPCPSPTPRVHSDSHPSSPWCHPAISSSVIPFFSRLQSLPASKSFPMSQLFAWGGQSPGVFRFSIIPSKEIPGLIFRMDWLDLELIYIFMAFNSSVGSPFCEKDLLFGKGVFSVLLCASRGSHFLPWRVFMFHLIFIHFPWGTLAMITRCFILYSLSFYLVMVLHLSDMWYNSYFNSFVSRYSCNFT